MQDKYDGEISELLFKVIIVGDIGTGKTSIIKKYVHDVFSQHYKSTIGVDFALKNISYNKYTNIKLQLWDIAGQERFGNMTRVYYKEAVAAVIVFDISRTTTFEAVCKWKNDIDSKIFLEHNQENIPTVLFGNKCDLMSKEPYSIIEDEMKKYCIENNFKGFFLVSAKEGVGIEEGFNFIVERIIENYPTNEIKSVKSDIVDIGSKSIEKNEQKKCCS